MEQDIDDKENEGKFVRFYTRGQGIYAEFSNNEVYKRAPHEADTGNCTACSRCIMEDPMVYDNLWEEWEANPTEDDHPCHKDNRNDTKPRYNWQPVDPLYVDLLKVKEATDGKNN